MADQGPTFHTWNSPCVYVDKSTVFRGVKAETSQGPYFLEVVIPLFPSVESWLQRTRLLCSSPVPLRWSCCVQIKASTWKTCPGAVVDLTLNIRSVTSPKVSPNISLNAAMFTAVRTKERQCWDLPTGVLWILVGVFFVIYNCVSSHLHAKFSFAVSY